MSEVVNCPFPGCNFEAKPKGLASHIRHRHANTTEEEESTSNLFRGLQWLSKNYCLVVVFIILTFVVNKGLSIIFHFCTEYLLYYVFDLTDFILAKYNEHQGLHENIDPQSTKSTYRQYKRRGR